MFTRTNAASVLTPVLVELIERSRAAQAEPHTERADSGCRDLPQYDSLGEDSLACLMGGRGCLQVRLLECCSDAVRAPLHIERG